MITAQIGMKLEEVDTPSLLIDLDIFEKNILQMVDDIKGTNVRLRPHAKTHKCADIALKQIQHGALGVCCQKVSEAEAMVQGGVKDIFITNEVIGKSKLKRLGELARHAKVSICADAPIHVNEYSRSAQHFGVEFDVFAELNVGANRCGVEPGEHLVALAETICRSPGLHFAGLQAYQGAAQHLRTYSERKKAIDVAVNLTMKAIELLANRGISCETLSGAGTGTYQIEIANGLLNEIQVGSYLFMDADYARNFDKEGSPISHFKQSLFVYSTVMSRPAADRAILDVGLKAVSVDSGMPLVHAIRGVEYIKAADEHGTCILHNTERDLKIGEKLKLVPGHCDPTVNLYDWFVGIRNNKVEKLWPINARGAFL